MQSHEREKVSRLLEAALATLKEEARGDQRSGLTSVSSIGLPANDAQLLGAPVVILIHPNSNEGEAIPSESATQAGKPNSCECSHDGSALHPGLERFRLSKPDSRDSAKMCFIEPDHVCVDSGACEALGH
jgi:hypothetical protein